MKPIITLQTINDVGESLWVSSNSGSDEGPSREWAKRPLKHHQTWQRYEALERHLSPNSNENEI